MRCTPGDYELVKADPNPFLVGTSAMGGVLQCRNNRLCSTVPLAGLDGSD
jgi:hypothetical protein